MAVRTKAQLKQQITSLLPDNEAGEISEGDMRSLLGDLVDSLALDSGGGGVVVADDMYFGTSVDDVPEADEATVSAVAGVGEILAYVGSMYLLIFRLATEADISSVVFSDDASNTNQVGVLSKEGATIVPTGETEAFNVWVSNQALMQPTDVTMTVS